MANFIPLVQGSTRMPLPHDGSILAILVRLHIVGGPGDVAKHLKEVHIRPHVVLCLLEELIDRGFPGYEKYDKARVGQRLRELYGSDPHAEFISAEVRAEIEGSVSVRRRTDREPWDKNATPAEAPHRMGSSGLVIPRTRFKKR